MFIPNVLQIAEHGLIIGTRHKAYVPCNQYHYGGNKKEHVYGE
jgi:hypothetical protein